MDLDGMILKGLGFPLVFFECSKLPAPSVTHLAKDLKNTSQAFMDGKCPSGSLGGSRLRSSGSNVRR